MTVKEFLSLFDDKYIDVEIYNGYDEIYNEYEDEQSSYDEIILADISDLLNDEKYSEIIQSKIYKTELLCDICNNSVTLKIYLQ